MKKYLPIIPVLLFLLCHGLIHAQTEIAPPTHAFAPQQTLTESDPQSFLITNTGDEPVWIHPDDILLRGADAQTMDYSVLSYNIEADDGNWPGRFAFMLEKIREVEVDIMGLQEVLQTAHLDNQAMQMADSLGFYYYFDSVDDEAQVHRYGNAIVSRYPIEETNFRALEPLDRYRNAIHARINVNGHIVDKYTTHLHHHPLDHDIRAVQIADLLDFIAETNSGGYIFVTGDFNANPDWDEMQQMYAPLQDVYPLFHENHLDPEHATLNHRMGHQMRRIDYVFFNKASMERLLPMSAEIIMDQEHEDPEMENDHFGVFAEFKLFGDDVDFVLHAFEEAVELAPQGSVSVEVSFMPQTTGEKQAILTVQHDQYDRAGLYPALQKATVKDEHNDATAEISGEGFDATVSDFPWHEDFSDTEEGSLPFGWTANQGNWGVQQSAHAGGDAPELVFFGEPSAEGVFYAISPPMQTTGLDSMQVSFRHVAQPADHQETYSLRFVTIADDQEYVVAEWTDAGDIVSGDQDFQIDSGLHGVGADRLYLAWVFDGESEHIDFWAIDNIALHAFPALQASPAQHDFGMQQIHQESDSLMITLKNIGGGELSVHPDEMLIEGEGAAQYILYPQSDAVQLESGDSTMIHVVFAPGQTGSHPASLSIHGQTVALTGQCFDPTITELPWEEDFSALVQGGVPKGWESDTRNWEAFNLSNAGGEPPEMVFWWEPQKTGRFYLTTPEIETHGMDKLALSFKYRVRNFQDPGQYTLSVISITDGGEEHVIYEWVDPAFIEPTELFAAVTAQEHGVGSDSFRLAWVFDGITNNMVSWDFDDIHLSKPGDTPEPSTDMGSIDFGQQNVHTSSEPKNVTIQNRGGGTWIIDMDALEIIGSNAADFSVVDLEEPVSLGLFESAEISVVFSPTATGQREAQLLIDELTVDLTGWGADAVDYFIYSDFTIVENGTAYTNVGGFREVPGFAAGSIQAADLQGEGAFGGVVLELDYDLHGAEDYTLYYMWAFPPADLSDFSHLVVYLKAETEVTGITLRLQDVQGFQGVDGESFAYMYADTEWQRFMVALDDMQLASWADNHPNMQEVQKIDIMFEKDVVQPQAGKVYVDLVGLIEEPTDAGQIPEAYPAFSVYPNPASAKVTVLTSPGAEITFYDINGKMVKRENASEDQHLFDISGLRPGVYVVKVKKQQAVKVQRLLVH